MPRPNILILMADQFNGTFFPMARPIFSTRHI